MAYARRTTSRRRKAPSRRSARSRVRRTTARSSRRPARRTARRVSSRRGSAASAGRRITLVIRQEPSPSVALVPAQTTQPKQRARF